MSLCSESRANPPPDSAATVPDAGSGERLGSGGRFAGGHARLVSADLQSV